MTSVTVSDAEHPKISNNGNIINNNLFIINYLLKSNNYRVKKTPQMWGLMHKDYSILLISSLLNLSRQLLTNCEDVCFRLLCIHGF